MSAALDIAQHIFERQQCSDRYCRCHDRGKDGQTFTHCVVTKHEDATPSMEITIKDGKLLVKCWSRCAQDDLVATLKARGLWPDASTQVGEGVQPPEAMKTRNQ